MPGVYSKAGTTIRFAQGTEGDHEKLSYEGPQGYRGWCTYELEQGALVIHAFDAQPQGQGLGTVLMFETALAAGKHGKGMIHALSVAATARGFYLSVGMHPEATQAAACAGAGLPREHAATYVGERNTLHNTSAAKFRAKGWS
ncbi:MAG: hypothetical protein H6825_00795 [Planctomycetes bacterium]|nr:hypothetical protein [Planctomycetota bacterium]